MLSKNIMLNSASASTLFIMFQQILGSCFIRNNFGEGYMATLAESKSNLHNKIEEIDEWQTVLNAYSAKPYAKSNYHSSKACK